MRVLRIATLLGVFFCSFASVAQTVPFAHGSGTAEDPYQISTVEEFTAIGSNNSAYLSSHFIQTADLVFDAEHPFPYMGNYGNSALAFRGRYDGNGYLITSTTPQAKPLFARISSGEVVNVRVVGVDVSSPGTNAMGVICGLFDSGRIAYCSIESCTIEGAYWVGAVVGDHCYGTIEYTSVKDCIVCVSDEYAFMNPERNVGGISGTAGWGSTIRACYVANTGLCSANFMGGMTNTIVDHTNTNCYFVPMGDQTSIDIDGNPEDESSAFCCVGNSCPFTGQALADYLNYGLDTAAFYYVDGEIVHITSYEYFFSRTGVFTSKKDGRFGEQTTWRYEPSSYKRFVVAENTTVEITDEDNFNEPQLYLEDGGNIINRTSSNVLGIYEKKLNVGKWNFIGFPFAENYADGYGIEPLAQTDGNMWAVAFDYTTGNWSNSYLHWNETHQDYVKNGNGIFVWPEEDSELVSGGLFNNGSVTVTNNATFSNENYGNWVALANPYPASLSMASLTTLPDVQGGIAYIFDGTSWDMLSTRAIGVGEGFFLNFSTSGEKTITFTKDMIEGYSQSAKSVREDREFVKVSVSTDGYKCPVRIIQNDEAADGYDIKDANKMFGDGSVAEPYLLTEGYKLCKEEVNSRSYTATMNIRSSESRSVDIVADNIPEEYTLAILDGETLITLNQGDVYTVNIGEGDNENRFKLLINQSNSSIEEPEEVSEVSIKNNERMIMITGGKNVRTYVYNTLGQKVYETTERNFRLSEVLPGTYVVSVRSNEGVHSAKIVVGR